MGGDHLWEAAGAIGEILGSIAVLASLVYIAVQVREHRIAAARAVRIERNNAFSKTMLETPEISEIVAKINEVDGSEPFVSEMQETYGLTAAQAELYQRYLSTAWRTIESDFLTLSEARVEGAIIWQFRAPSSKRFIEIRRKLFDKSFMRLVDDVKRQVEERDT
jgi:hypothetical protein